MLHYITDELHLHEIRSDQILHLCSVVHRKWMFFSGKSIQLTAGVLSTLINLVH